MGISNEERERIMEECDSRLAVLLFEPFRLIKGQNNA
jgi:hypothetical protein